MRIRITVRHQDECSIACWRLNYSNNDDNQVYVHIVDKFYVTVDTRIRRIVLKEIRRPRGVKDRAGLSELSQTESIQAIIADFSNHSGA